MKKCAFLSGVVFLAVLAAAGIGLAQVSDYEIVENFKQGYRKVETALASETDPARLDRIAGQIRALKSRFTAHEKLIDTGLYPETFGSVFKRLESVWASRQRTAVERRERVMREEKLVTRQRQLVAEVKEKTAENEKLRRELEGLSEDVARLSGESAALRKQIHSLRGELKSGRGTISTLKAENEKERETIDRINQLVATLNASLASRDLLLANMKDKLKARDAVVAAMGKRLLAGFSKPRITPAETRALGEGVQENDFFGTVLATIEENIRFLESTFLTPGDLEFSRAQLMEFEEMWESVGPRLADAYPGDGAAAEDMQQIRYALDQWSAAIDDAAWTNLQAVFDQHGFSIGGFKNGTEFRDRLISFVYEEKKARGRDNQARFMEEVWDAEVRPLWIPYLQAKGKFDPANLADLEAVLADWGKRSYTLYWLIALGLILVAFITILMIRRKSGP